MKIFRNAITLLRTPGMMKFWFLWNLKHAGIKPKVKLLGGKYLVGFRSFSEFWSAIHLVPSSSEVSFIQMYSGKSGVVIDVGANIGCMAFTLSHLCPEAQIHAFEPSPETFSILQMNIEANDANRIKGHQIALGRESGWSAFLNDGRAPAMNRLLCADSVISERSIQVEVMSLDEFIDQQEIRHLAFLKIDVEGYEADVIRGAGHILNNGMCKAGLVELCPANLRAVGSSVEELLSVVHSSGCKLYFIENDGHFHKEVTMQNAARVILTNVALVHER